MVAAAPARVLNELVAFSRALRVATKRPAATAAKTASHKSMDAPPPTPGLVPLQEPTRGEVPGIGRIWPVGPEPHPAASRGWPHCRLQEPTEGPLPRVGLIWACAKSASHSWNMDISRAPQQEPTRSPGAWMGPGMGTCASCRRWVACNPSARACTCTCCTKPEAFCSYEPGRQRAATR